MSRPLPIAKTAETELCLPPARAIGSQLGREIIRGVLGSILGGRKR